MNKVLKILPLKILKILKYFFKKKKKKKKNECRNSDDSKIMKWVTSIYLSLRNQIKNKTSQATLSYATMVTSVTSWIREFNSST